jgi:hypothetical protein
MGRILGRYCPLRGEGVLCGSISFEQNPHVNLPHKSACDSLWSLCSQALLTQRYLLRLDEFFLPSSYVVNPYLGLQMHTQEPALTLAFMRRARSKSLQQMENHPTLSHFLRLNSTTLEVKHTNLRIVPIFLLSQRRLSRAYLEKVLESVLRLGRM